MPEEHGDEDKAEHYHAADDLEVGARVAEHFEQAAGGDQECRDESRAGADVVGGRMLFQEPHRIEG